ncbi:hypothetical protein FVER53590_28993 [Fusarium verticillioides]|nr:hypothetical protein FVER53590_28993 [Fusarium verticillioides]
MEMLKIWTDNTTDRWKLILYLLQMSQPLDRPPRNSQLLSLCRSTRIRTIIPPQRSPQTALTSLSSRMQLQ